MEIAAWKSNYELTIKIENLIDYYHSDLISCNVFNGQLEVELKIPLQQKKVKYNVYQITPLPFFDKNKICQVQINNKLIIADNKNSLIKSLSEADVALCKPNGNLCHIPQHRINNHFDDCVTSIFKNKPQTEILTKCIFACEQSNNREVVATQLSETKFLVTNFHTLLAINLETGNKKINQF